MTGKFLFSTLEDETLVEAVAQCSCLYDSSDKDFKSQQSRESAWSKIGAIVGRNADDCKKRWRNIKDTYMKFRKTKYKGHDEKPKSKWPLLQYLSFLDSVSTRRRNQSKGHEDNTEEAENVKVESEGDGSGRRETEIERVENKKRPPTNHFEKANKKRREDDKVNDTFQLRSDEKNATHQSNADNDPILLFFKSMAMTVKTFEPHLIVEAKARICEIVNEIELKSIQIKEAAAEKNATVDCWMAVPRT